MSGSNGAGLYHAQGTTTLDATIVRQNHEINGNPGGGIYAVGGTVDLTNNSEVYANTPDNCVEAGGAITGAGCAAP